MQTLLIMKNNRTIYLSGKITGLTLQQAAANFRTAERQCRHYQKIINPINFKPFLGIESWWCYMVVCLFKMLQADDVYMLDNWEHSRGARIEKRFAEMLKLTIYYQK